MKITKHYTITPAFAKANKLPIAVAAVVVRETERAAYLYGHGLVPANNSCARCGRPLTHPGSVLIGVGPECLGDWGMRDVVLDNLTPAQAEALRAQVTSRVVDQWIPKSCLKLASEAASIEPIQVPADHAMVVRGTKAARKVTKQGDVMVITFPFNRADLAIVQKLPGRRFNPNNKTWSCPVSIPALQALQAADWVIEPDLLKLLSANNAVIEKVTGDQGIPGLKKQLFPFQQQGVAFVESKGGRALISDEMGLGKTVQALAWLQLHPEHRPAVIVCPASLKLNWAREAAAWLTDPQVQVVSGTAPVAFTGKILIINYDILTHHVDALVGLGVKTVVLDESHYIKNNKTLRTKATKKLTKSTPHVIALSGTPAINRPVELFNTLKIINPDAVPNFWTYVHKYCGAKHTGFGWDFTGSSNQADLHQLLTSTLMIRRLKADVLTDLPEKLYSFVPMELANEAEYAQAENSFINWVRVNKGAEAAERASQAEQLVQVEALKQLAVAGKMAHVINWINNHLEANDKLVVFATHKTTIDRLMNTYGKVAVKVDGSVTAADRDAAVQAFQTNAAIKLFVGNIKAAGVGLTLTAASAVAFIELPWSPGELVQAEDRCHRIGQRNAVNVYYLVAQNTIEEQIARLLDSKRNVLNAILDGQSPSETGLLTSLITSYNTEGGTND